jgi:hypothetical protein
VTMQVFQKKAALLDGVDEAIAILGRASVAATAGPAHVAGAIGVSTDAQASWWAAAGSARRRTGLSHRL